MKNNKISNFIRLICFLLIAATLFSLISNALERKTLYGEANYMGKLNEFYDLPENSLEYICVGSSHVYCNVSPLEIWNESGIKGFVMATQQQPLTASYYYIKEAFKTQKPKVVILEGLMALRTEHTEGVIYDAIDPLHFSLNKLQMINDLVDSKESDAYYFNILKYHSRWKNVTVEEVVKNYNAENDIFKGYVPLESDYVGQNQIPDYNSATSQVIPNENLETLNNILNVVEENGAKLILLIAPYEVEYYTGMFKAEYEWAQKNSVEVIDYSLRLDEIGIDPNEDYYDIGHLDLSGATKLSRDLAGILTQKGLKADNKCPQWSLDYQKYSEAYFK